MVCCFGKAMRSKRGTGEKEEQPAGVCNGARRAMKPILLWPVSRPNNQADRKSPEGPPPKPLVKLRSHPHLRSHTRIYRRRRAYTARYKFPVAFVAQSGNCALTGYKCSGRRRLLIIPRGHGRNAWGIPVPTLCRGGVFSQTPGMAALHSGQALPRMRFSST